MAKFRAIINAVRQAITGNATTADVLSGKTFMSAASPNEQTGAMTNYGSVTASLTADGQVYTIPAGYHNGAGTVTANIPSEGYTTFADIVKGSNYYDFLTDLNNAQSGTTNSFTQSNPLENDTLSFYYAGSSRVVSAKKAGTMTGYIFNAVSGAHMAINQVVAANEVIYADIPSGSVLCVKID